ncbi:uncharacterized [Lates japonicus]
MFIGEMIQSVQSCLTHDFRLSDTSLQPNSVVVGYSTEKIRLHKMAVDSRPSLRSITRINTLLMNGLH